MSCSSQFIRRSYLSKHLVIKHGYITLRAWEFACRAPRGDIRHNIVAEYEDISEDDSVFDLIHAIEAIRRHDEKIADFDMGYLDDIRLAHGSNTGNTNAVFGDGDNVWEEVFDNDVNDLINGDGDTDAVFGDGENIGEAVFDNNVVDSVNDDGVTDQVFGDGDSIREAVCDDDVDYSINGDDVTGAVLGDDGNVVEAVVDGDVDDSVNGDDGTDAVYGMVMT